MGVHFVNFLYETRPVSPVFPGRPIPVKVGIVGGSIRNLIIELAFGNAPQTADIDIFIGRLPDDYVITGLLEGEVFEKTDLGGVRWHPKSSDVAFDLCLLPKFVLIQKYRLQPTLENLLNCIDFTPNNSSPTESCLFGVIQDLCCLRRSFHI